MTDTPRRATATPPRHEARPAPLLLVLLGVLPLLLALWAPLGLLDDFEATAGDARMRLRNTLDPRPLPPTVRLIGVGAIDEERLDEDLRTRQAYSHLLTLLGRWGSRVAVFDIFFDSPQPKDLFLAMALGRPQPISVLAYSFRPVEYGLQPEGAVPEEFAELDVMAASGEDAAELAAAIGDIDDHLNELRQWVDELRMRDPDGAQTREALRGLAWSREMRHRLQRRWFIVSQGRPVDVPGHARPFEAPDLRLLSPRLSLAAPHHGFANVEKGAESVVRRAPLVFRHGGRLFPHLSLAAVLAYHGVSWRDVEIDWGSAIRFTPPGGEPIAIPIDERGLYTVNFREGEELLNRHPTLTAVVVDDFRQRLLGGDEAAAALFGGAIVLVGEVISGGEATDLEPIPIATAFPMVGFHANIIANILQRDFLRTPHAALTAALVALMGLLMAVAYWLLPFGRATALAVLLAVVYTLAQYAAFQLGGWVLPAVRPLLGTGLAVMGFFGYLVVVKDRDRRRVRDVFMKSVSPRIAEEMLRNYGDPSIWGDQREITVLFVDIRGYTTLSEQHGPREVLEVLEDFYDTVSEAVFRHEGQVNKFLGDAVLALFGALGGEAPNHAERAARAAAEIARAMVRLNATPEMRARGLELNTGAGVNSGIATVGLVGRRRIRIEYTALGDAVNVASRLQSLASAGEVIFSQRTIDLMGDRAGDILAEVGLDLGDGESLSVKGRKQPVAVRRATLTKG